MISNLKRISLLLVFVLLMPMNQVAIDTTAVPINDPVTKKTSLLFSSSGEFEYYFRIAASFNFSTQNISTRLYLIPNQINGSLDISFTVVANESQTVKYPGLPDPFFLDWFNLTSVFGRTIYWLNLYQESGKLPSKEKGDDPNFYKLRFHITGKGVTNVTVENEVQSHFRSKSYNTEITNTSNPYNSIGFIQNLSILAGITFIAVLFYLSRTPRGRRPNEWEEYNL